MEFLQPQVSRRSILKGSACGFGSLALAGLLSKESTGANASTAHQPHFPPKAKRIIFLFMQGGPSQVDTFDYKPLLEKQDGQQVAFDDARTIANTGNRGTNQRVMKSPWKFRQYGEAGLWGSDLFPNVSEHLDDLCLIHSMHTEGVAHGPATLFLHCGATNFIRPSFGSWVTYGLGSENENLPGFISICPSAGNGGARNYGNAFLPSSYQGTTIGMAGRPLRDDSVRNLKNPKLSLPQQQKQLEFLQSLNAEQVAGVNDRSELEAVIKSYELAWRMQSNVPDILDLSHETQSTLNLYGIGEEETESFGRQCLMARRLCEEGVRFIQVTYGDGTANPAWDQHSDLPKHAKHAKAVDKPIAGLLADLEQRGLLEDTIVWYSGEFGRTPYAQKNGTGRDHNPAGFTSWLAGNCLRSAFTYGSTDEFGHKAIRDKVHMHDMHATLLHLLGIDHTKLTYRYAGRDFRLTDVHGEVVHPIFS